MLRLTPFFFRSRSLQTCNYVFNKTFTSLFDLSSAGWLRGNLTFKKQGSDVAWTVRFLCLCVFPVFLWLIASSNVGHALFSSIVVDKQLSCTRNYTVSSGYVYENMGLCSGFDISDGGFYNSDDTYGFVELVTDHKGTPKTLSFGGTSSYTDYFGFVTFSSFKKSRGISLANMPFPEECRGTRCKTNVTSTDIVLYRQHGNSTLYKQLDDVNLADIRGESYWLCDYGGLTKSYSPIVSKYRLTISPDYSQCKAAHQKGPLFDV